MDDQMVQPIHRRSQSLHKTFGDGSLNKTALRKNESTASSGKIPQAMRSELPRLAWDWALVAPWEEAVHDPRNQAQPTDVNGRNYLLNQQLVREGVLLLIGDVAMGVVPNVDAFRARLAKLNAQLMLGADGRTLYFPPTTNLGEKTNGGQTLRDRVAGVIPPSALPEQFAQLFAAIRDFGQLEPNSSRAALHEVAARAHYAVVGNWGWPFVLGNNSLTMNIVNAMLRLHGLHGVAHSHLDKQAWDDFGPIGFNKFLPKFTAVVDLHQQSVGAAVGGARAEARLPGK